MAGYPVITGESPGGLAFNDSPANYGYAGNSTHPAPPPGTIWIDQDNANLIGSGDRTFRFVQLAADSISPNVGDILVGKDQFNTIATANITSGYIYLATGANTTRQRNGIIGVVQSPTLVPGQPGALTPGNFGWLQISGLHPGVNSGSNTIGGGDTVVLSTTNQQGTGVTAGTASTFLPVGTAWGNSTANTPSTTGNSTPTRLYIPE